ncbi:hypothetical protein, partial [Klebsiella pneumoniae]|uniref:hypothetical protein n=1 Tax=Klebsiella pneumoniae TaxID=573 RepID=UPI001C8F6BC2
IQIAYMDTDAFMYQIKTDDLYKDLKTFPHNNDFDFSDYPVDHPTYDLCVNKMILGKFKDETKGVPIEDSVTLMSKMYAIKLLLDRSREQEN